MAKTSHNVVFIQDHYQVKDKKSDLFYKPNTSTLYIRSYQPDNNEKKHKKISLKIKLKNTDVKAYFDENKQRFKDIKKFPQGQLYNEKIEDELKRIGIYEDLSQTPDRRKSFLKYWQSIIDTITVHGTKIKHAGVKTRLEKYLKSIPREDLKFSEINPDFLRKVYHNFKETANPKKLTTGTANHYLKILHGVINMAKKDNHYIYTPDPFSSFKYNKPDEPIKEGKVLSRSSLELLLTMDDEKNDMETNMYAIPRLNDDLNKYRLALLFQLFANGMRVSDMLLLRWNNIESYTIKYSMFKTKRAMVVPLNTNLINVITKIVPDNGKMLKFFNRYKNGQTTAPVIINNETSNLNLSKVEEKLKSITISKHRDGVKQAKAKRDGYAEIDGYYVKPEDISLYYILANARTYLTSRMESKMALDLNLWNKERKNEFIFPFLKNADFEEINEKNEFGKITEKQYKKIKHATIVYNRKLKEIAQFYGIKSSLTTHSARHSFASYLLSMGNVNTFDIQQLLGHSNLQITDKYLQKHFNIGKLEDTNRRLSNENTIL
jgi:integrase